MKTMWLTNIERDEDGRVISCEGQCGEEEFYLDSREEIEQVTSQGYTIGNPWVLYDEVRFAEKDYVTERMILALDMQFVQSTRERFRLNLSFRSNMSNEDMDAMIRISDDYKHFSETMAAVRIGKNLILMSEKQLAFPEDCSDMMRYCLFEKVSFDAIDCSQMICCNGFFAYAHINEIDLLHFCTETVKYMIGMFRGVKTDSIDFSPCEAFGKYFLHWFTFNTFPESERYDEFNFGLDKNGGRLCHRLSGRLSDDPASQALCPARRRDGHPPGRAAGARPSRPPDGRTGDLSGLCAVGAALCGSGFPGAGSAARRRHHRRHGRRGRYCLPQALGQAAGPVLRRLRGHPQRHRL